MNGSPDHFKRLVLYWWNGNTHTYIYYYLFIDVNIPRYLLRKNVLDTLHLLLQYLWSHWFPLLLYKGFRPRVSCTMIAMISMDFSFLGLDWNLTTRTGNNCKVKDHHSLNFWDWNAGFGWWGTKFRKVSLCFYYISKFWGCLKFSSNQFLPLLTV